MALSNDLISQFVKTTKDDTKKNSEQTVYGTIVEYNGDKYVKIDGSELLTPISSTTNVENDERVTVMIKNHTATVTGNLSSPAARTEEVEAIGSKISEFDTIIADKVSTKELEAERARINNLVADNVTIKGTLDAANADIDNLQADNVTIHGTLNAHKGYIDDLEATKLSAESADIKYANIDFSNIGKAAMEYFYANSGLIKNVVVGDQTITGNLVGVTISGDLIEGNTIVAEKLVVKGEDGLYYKLNTDGITTEAEQTDYNSLNGSVIRAKSITATQISVKDLVAFGATIGGFNITDSSLYSGVKESVDNTTRGIYFDKTGQVAIGDANNYIKFYKYTDGTYKLDVSADTVRFGSSGKNVEQAVNDAIVSTVEQFYLSTSPSGLSGGSWSTDQPAWEDGKYIWRRTLVTHGDGTGKYTPSAQGVCITGNTGAIGAKGDKGDKGATGKGVKSNTRYYCLQASATKPSKPTTNPPDSKWTTTEPSYTTGSTSYLYTVDRTVYTDNSFLYSDVSLSSSYEAAKAAYAKAVNAETEISKTNEEVALKASKNEVTETLKGYSTTAAMNAAITTKANEITSSVEANYTTKNEFDSLQIGGTNFFLNSSFSGYVNSGIYTFSGEEVTFSASSTGEQQGVSFGLSVSDSFRKRARSNEITISVEYKVEDDLTRGTTNPYMGIELVVSRNDVTGGNTQWLGCNPYEEEVRSDKWKKLSVVYSITDYDISYAGASIWFRDIKGTIKFRHPKVEIGNKATDWSPAPEDIESRVASAETRITQTETSIKEKASQTEVNSLGTRITTAEENIDAANGRIDLRVTQEEFNNLQIGETNLILGSSNTYKIVSGSHGDGGGNAFKFEHGDDYPDKWCRFDGYVNGAVATSVPRAIIGLSNVSADRTYTFSADILNYGNTMRICICPTTSSNEMIGSAIYYTDSEIFYGFKRISVTSKPLPSGTAKVLLYIEKLGSGETYFDTRKWKFVEGNKASAWSPAPEDTSIGGHNLWINTSKMRENNFFALTSSSTDDWVMSNFYNGPIYTRESFKAGDVITVQAKSNLPWSSVHGGNSTNKNKVGFWLLYGSYSKVSIGDWPEKQVFVPGDDSNTHFTKTVTVPYVDGVTDIYIGFRFNSYSDGSTVITAKLWDVKLERGNKATEWSPALNDGIKTTTVTIDANGMDVATGGTINFHTSNFNVTPPDGYDQLFSVNAADRTVRAQCGYFDDYLYAPNMATKCESATIDIGVDGGLPSIQAAWDYLPDVCGEVRFRICGNAPGYAELKGKHVSFLIIESADTSQMYDVGTIWMWGVHGRASYVTMSKNGTSSDDACRMYCSMFNFENVKFASAGRGLLLFNGSYAFLRWCSITGVGSVSKMAGHGLELYSSSVNMYDCSGVAGGNGIYLASGSFAALKGNTFGPTHNTGGGVVVGDYTIDGTTYDPPAVSTSSTFTASTCVTWQSTYGSTWKKITGSVRTKVESRHSTTSNGFDYRTGWWVLDTGTAIKTALSGKTISKATVTIKRNDTNSDTRKCHLCYHSMTNTKMNGYDGAASGIGSITGHGIMTEIGSYNLNPSAETVITLPSSVYTKLQDGTIKGFGLVDNATDYRQIMCDNTCTLIVVYT